METVENIVGEKEKMLVTSIVSFSHNIANFRSYIVATGCPSERRPRRRLVVTGDSARIQDETTESSARFFSPFPNKPWFLRVCSASLLKTLWEKDELLVMNNSSFSHSVFYPFGKHSAIFIKFEIVVCKLFQIGRV